MPGYDGTGPLGRGPNGRGLGPCGQGNIEPRRRSFALDVVGMGRSRFGWFNRPIVDEKEDLKAERNWLKQQLDAINERLTEIED